MSPLHPFSGTHAKVHLGADGLGGHVITEPGNATSGTIEHAFNSLGFRSEEFQEGASKRIFVCGDSQTFGTGLHFEQTWPRRFKRLFAEREAAPLDAVNLLNFAEGGASNDYIARVILSQVARVRPDLVMVLFSWVSRVEFLWERGLHSFGLWSPTDFQNALASVEIEEKQKRFELLLEAVTAFYTFYTDRVGAMNLLKNTLLVQSFLQARHIPFVFAWSEDLFAKDALQTDPAIGPLLEQVDRRSFCPSAPARLELDLAGDDLHPGPECAATFAAKMFETYSRLSDRQPR